MFLLPNLPPPSLVPTPSLTDMLLNGNQMAAVDPGLVDDTGNTALHLACLQVGYTLNWCYYL